MTPSSHATPVSRDLDQLAMIRKRPGMYLGWGDEYGLLGLIWALIDQPTGAALEGGCRWIEVALLGDGVVRISDDCPVSPEGAGTPGEGLRPMAHLTGWDLDDPRAGRYPTLEYYTSGVSNALSEWFEAIETDPLGRSCRVRCEQGVVTEGPATVQADGPAGTRVTLRADPTIFQTIEFDRDRVVKRLVEVACLIPGLTVGFEDQRSGERWTLREPDGPAALLRHRNANTELIGPLFRVEGTHGGIDVAIALQCRRDQSSVVQAYFNTSWLFEEGTYRAGLRSVIDRALGLPARADDLWTRERLLEERNRFRGLSCVVAYRTAEPIEFGGSTRRIPYDTKLEEALDTVSSPHLVTYFKAHPKVAAQLDR